MTVSHRPSLWQYHDFLLKFDEEGNWTFGPMDKEIAQKAADEAAKNKQTAAKMAKKGD